MERETSGNSQHAKFSQANAHNRAAAAAAAQSHRIDHRPVQFVRKEFVFCGRYPFDQILDALPLLLCARWLRLRRQNGRLLIIGIFQRNQFPLFGRRDLFVFVVEDVADRQTLASRGLHGALRRTW